MEEGPVKVQSIDPLGAAAPTAPVTTAVYVMFPPRTGLITGTDTRIVGVATPTSSEVTGDGGSAEKLASPLYVAVAAYVPICVATTLHV